MKIYVSIFLTVLTFFSFTTPVAVSSEKEYLPSKEEEIEHLRADNLVLLRLINFKFKYSSYEEYYKQTDSSLSEQ